MEREEESDGWTVWNGKVQSYSEVGRVGGEGGSPVHIVVAALNIRVEAGG